ncbi:hypothetical protein [Erwinia pyrifoliae]|uniref:hypothetical protein n=1 Tax=Erwinia pyrifoliae TaxID=79967 RepID=UPI0011D0E7EB|nr:hypothetical protein [Erwinia pyrifoliae]MCA8876459.1 hypothetical protein [Erwinia pyrifoliae]MCT2386576.1 hypothetical protein [Erwinia pyrifoliae]MCU8587827.1 hypothetical protein [Erwinia pyrifoliae]
MWEILWLTAGFFSSVKITFPKELVMLGFIINTFFSSGVGSSKGTNAIRLGSDEKKIIEKIFTLQNSNQLLETNQRVPTLFTLAAKSFVEGKYSDACSLKSTFRNGYYRQ